MIDFCMETTVGANWTRTSISAERVSPEIDVKICPSMSSQLKKGMMSFRDDNQLNNFEQI
jgi:hypothetical protein